MQNYLKFWNIEHPVFNTTGLGAELYISEILQNKISIILDHLKQPSVIVSVEGDLGVGKTALASWLYKNIPYKDFDCIYCQPPQSNHSEHWVLNQILSFLNGPNMTGFSRSKKKNLITMTLEQLINEKRKLIVIVDDADRLLADQNMSDIKEIFDQQSIAGQCLSFVLIGTDLIKKTKELNHPLTESISFSCELENLSNVDRTKDYIVQHFEGNSIDKKIFSDKILKSIHSLTNGNPASINKLSEAMLIEAASLDCKIIDQQTLNKTLKSIPTLSQPEVVGRSIDIENHEKEKVPKLEIKEEEIKEEEIKEEKNNSTTPIKRESLTDFFKKKSQ